MELENSSRFTDIVNSIRDAVEAGSITNDMIAEAFDIIRRGLETSADSSDIQEALEQAIAPDDFIGRITVSELNRLNREDLVKYAYGHLSGKNNYLRLVSDFNPDLHLGTVQIVGNLSGKALDILCFTALNLDAEGNLNLSESAMTRSHIYRRNIYGGGGDDTLQVSPWIDISPRVMSIYDLETLSLADLDAHVASGNPSILIDGPNCRGTAQILKAANEPAKYCLALNTTYLPTNGAFADKGSMAIVEGESLKTFYCFIYDDPLNVVSGRSRTNWVDRVDKLETKVDNKVDKVEGKGLSANDFTDALKNQLLNANGLFGKLHEEENGNIIEWNHTHNANGFVAAGTYRIKGQRTNNADNLPIGNVGSGHTLDGILYVFDSSLMGGTGQTDDSTITQLLVLSNRVGGQEGGQWIRSGYGVNTDSLSWDPWAKMQTNMEVGVVNDTMQLMDSAGNQTLNTSLGMNSLVDNGIYSGVYLPNNGTSVGADAETFVMIVINNYAIRGANKTIRQIKFAIQAKSGSGLKFQTRHIDYECGTTSFSIWQNAVSTNTSGINLISGSGNVAIINGDSDIDNLQLNIQSALRTSYEGYFSVSGMSFMGVPFWRAHFKTLVPDTLYEGTYTGNSGLTLKFTISNRFVPNWEFFLTKTITEAFQWKGLVEGIGTAFPDMNGTVYVTGTSSGLNLPFKAKIEFSKLYTVGGPERRFVVTEALEGTSGGVTLHKVKSVYNNGEWTHTQLSN